VEAYRPAAENNHRPGRAQGHLEYGAELVHVLPCRDEIEAVPLLNLVLRRRYARLLAAPQHGYHTRTRERDVGDALADHRRALRLELAELYSTVGELLHRRGIEARENGDNLPGGFDLGIHEEVDAKSLWPHDLTRSIVGLPPDEQVA